MKTIKLTAIGAVVVACLLFCPAHRLFAQPRTKTTVSLAIPTHESSSR
jgi:hypothetical protein